MNNMDKQECSKKLTRHINVISNVLDTTPDNDDLGLLYAISEGFHAIEKIKEDWRIAEEEKGPGYESVADESKPGSATEDVITIQDTESSSGKRFNAGHSIDDENQGVVTQDGIQLHRTGSRHQVSNETDELIVTQGAYGTSRPAFWSLGVYLQSLGSTKAKRLVATIAWSVCFVSLIIGLIMISLEFMESRNSKSKVIRYTSETSLTLPDLQICNVDSSFPPFVHLPSKKYVGLPTTWVDAVIFPGAQSKVIKYPQTHNESVFTQLRVTAFNRKGSSCDAGGKADPVKFQRETHTPPDCFYCMYIKRNPAITIKKKYGTMSDHTNYVSSLVLRMSRSRLVEKCRHSFAPPSLNEFRVFRAIIGPHGPALQRLGILNFGGMNVSDPKDAEILFPLFRQITRDFSVRDVLDMYCNVYLFSGYFYPATKGEIRYKFIVTHKGRAGLWQRSGNGPYFPPHFEEWFHFVSKQSNPNGTIGGEKTGFIVSRGDIIVSFTNATEAGNLHQLSWQYADTITGVSLKRSLIKGKEAYSGFFLNTKMHRVYTGGVDFVYIVKIGFEKFVTRAEADQTTMSMTRYLADFFGLISLFLDISVYTVFVAPIVVRIKRRRIKEAVQVKS